MKRIGNIVSEKQVKGFCGPLWGDEDDGTCPVLYVGMDNASEHIDGFSVLKKRYGDTWWTFAKNERRAEYTDDIAAFRDYCLRKAMSSVRYVYIDFTKYRFGRNVALLRYMLSDERKHCFITRGGGFLFVYSESRSTVFGISLSLLWYVGIDPERVIRILKTQKSNVFVNGTSFAYKEYRAIINDEPHYIPVLHSMLSKDVKKN